VTGVQTCALPISGLQVGYSINEARHLNQRNSQISLLASFQWSFDTGGNR